MLFHHRWRLICQTRAPCISKFRFMSLHASLHFTLHLELDSCCHAAFQSCHRSTHPAPRDRWRRNESCCS